MSGAPLTFLFCLPRKSAQLGRCLVLTSLRRCWNERGKSRPGPCRSASCWRMRRSTPSNRQASICGLAILSDVFRRPGALFANLRRALRPWAGWCSHAGRSPGRTRFSWRRSGRLQTCPEVTRAQSRRPGSVLVRVRAALRRILGEAGFREIMMKPCKLLLIQQLGAA